MAGCEGEDKGSDPQGVHGMGNGKVVPEGAEKVMHLGIHQVDMA